MTSSQSGQTPTRYASVDALRGITVAAMLLVNNPGTWSHVFAPLEHAQWNGCTPTDLIFPFFLVIVGVSIGLGVVPRVEQGGDRAALTRTVLVRALRILGLGLLLHLLAWWWLDLPHYRPWGVLQRIGLCFAIAGMAAIWLSARMQWLCIGLLLGGYAALLAAGGTPPWHNLPSRVDTALLGPLLYQYDAATGLGHDPEGLLSTLGALASTLLGLHAAALLRSGRPLRLLAAAIVLLVAGGVWSHWLPINKNLWTPSYVLWTAGWAYAALWLAHRLVDRNGWPALRRQRHHCLCRLRRHGAGNAGHGELGLVVRAGVRPLDHPAGRRRNRLAGDGAGLRRVVVAADGLAGPAADLPEDMNAACLKESVIE